MKSLKNGLRKWALVLALAMVVASIGVSVHLANPASAETALDPTDPASVYTSANPIPDIAERVRPGA